MTPDATPRKPKRLVKPKRRAHRMIVLIRTDELARIDRAVRTTSLTRSGWVRETLLDAATKAA